MTRAADNPFRSERMEGLAFRPHDPAVTRELVIDRFRAAGWRGAVVGPHGSGKSTLLRALADAAEADGRPVLRVFTNRSAPWRERAAVAAEVCGALPTMGEGAVVCFDGWCHLTPGRRRALKRACGRAGAGLIGLAHLCGWGLPVVYRTRTNPRLFAELAAELDPAGAAGPDPARALRRSRGNIRHALLRLYDAHADG